MNFSELENLLQRRLKIIGNDEMRNENPDKQLELLKSVSQHIDAWRDRNWDSLPFKLRHFLSNYSLEKALSFIQSTDEEERAKKCSDHSS